MIVLRCTRRLLSTASFPVTRNPPSPTAPLGEWCVNAVPLPFPGRWIVMYTSSQTLLAVVVPGRSLKTTLAAFQKRVPALLLRLELPPAWIETQREKMVDIVYAPTADRRILGSMNDLAYQIRVIAESARDFTRVDWDGVEMELARVPLSLLKYRYPRDVASTLAERSDVV